jgi:hypothetical protein
MFVLPHFQGYNKNEIFAEYWDHIGMHRMFLNVATFRAGFSIDD